MMYIIVCNINGYNYCIIVRELDSLDIFLIKDNVFFGFYLLADPPKLLVSPLNCPPVIVFIFPTTGRSFDLLKPWLAKVWVDKAVRVALRIPFYARGIYLATLSK